MILLTVYNTGVDFAGLLSEVSSIRIDEQAVRTLKVVVLPEYDFRNKGGIEGAFYDPVTNTVYLQAETILSAVDPMIVDALIKELFKFTAHESVHAGLPRGIPRNTAESEMFALSVLGKALNLVSTKKEENLALQLVAWESIRDVLYKIKDNQIRSASSVAPALSDRLSLALAENVQPQSVLVGDVLSMPKLLLRIGERKEIFVAFDGRYMDKNQILDRVNRVLSEAGIRSNLGKVIHLVDTPFENSQFDLQILIHKARLDGRPVVLVTEYENLWKLGEIASDVIKIVFKSAVSEKDRLVERLSQSGLTEMSTKELSELFSQTFELEMGSLDQAVVSVQTYNVQQ